MLRQIFAIIVAVIIGVAIAKAVEGLVGGGVAPGEAASAGEQLGLVAGWFAGAFVAAALALLLGRRWAPLGWLGAATILFAAGITLTTYSLPLLLWPASIAVCAGGGWLAKRLLKAQQANPHPKPKEKIFD